MQFGRTALWLAASGGHLEMVNVLLDAGADTTLRDKDGTAPTDVAKGKVKATIQVSGGGEVEGEG